jgi:hypothetical protein
MMDCEKQLLLLVLSLDIPNVSRQLLLSVDWLTDGKGGTLRFAFESKSFS